MMEYECILCGKVVDTGKILAPGNWREYYGVWLCEECSQKLGEKIDQVEFLRELKSAELALKFAKEYHIHPEIREKIESLISEIQNLIERCRNDDGIIDSERFDVVLIS